MRATTQTSGWGVVIVSYPEDEHGTTLERGLQELGATVVRLSLQSLASTEWTWELGTGVRLIETVEPRGNWSGIWRRPGHAHIDDIASTYATFANSESRDAFRGGLLASGIRWINRPKNLWFAEHKIVQLESARRLGIRVPRTIVTNDEEVASAFVRDVGSVVAKAVRYGLVATDPTPMMAWVRPIEPDERFDFSGVPVMLQERVAAAAHYRVVTVGTQCFVSRLESTEADWRVLADDLQAWRRCSPTDLPDRLQDQASTIAGEMGLGFTSQDWVLESQGDAIFLELNPNGQWLFVDDQHHGEITRAIVAWLIAPP